jgi:hypothetical protein
LVFSVHFKSINTTKFLRRQRFTSVWLTIRRPLTPFIFPRSRSSFKANKCSYVRSLCPTLYPTIITLAIDFF